MFFPREIAARNLHVEVRVLARELFPITEANFFLGEVDEVDLIRLFMPR